MTPRITDVLPTVRACLSLAAYAAAGFGYGALHFGSLWWSVRRWTSGRRVGPSIAVMVGRYMLLAGLLVLLAREGTLPLLATVFGLLAARSVTTRRIVEHAR